MDGLFYFWTHQCPITNGKWNRFFKADEGRRNPYAIGAGLFKQFRNCFIY